MIVRIAKMEIKYLLYKLILNNDLDLVINIMRFGLGLVFNTTFLINIKLHQTGVKLHLPVEK